VEGSTATWPFAISGPTGPSKSLKLPTREEEGEWQTPLSITHTENHSKQAVTNETTEAPFPGNPPAYNAGFWSAGFSIKLWTPPAGLQCTVRVQTVLPSISF